MANEQHLEILKQGGEVWNVWREENSDLRPDFTWADINDTILSGGNHLDPFVAIPDLSEANLTGANLRGADLTWADLSGANLSEANLRGADLTSAILFSVDFSGANLKGASLSGAVLNEANFRKADLSGAKLIGADLSDATLTDATLTWANLGLADLTETTLIRTRLNEADLTEAILTWADLSDADLYGVDLSEADLNGASFTSAKIGSTTLGNVDLSGVIGLEAVSHYRPSTIGIDTIFKSKGKIPESFLRGCGVPDILIKYMPALTQQSTQFYSCFISYSSKDIDFAERLHADLQSKGVRCWSTPEDLKVGERIRVGIDKAIRVHEKLLLVLSEHSLGSDWVEQEAETAMEQEPERKETVLFPIRLDEAIMEERAGWAAHIKRTRNIGDFSRWKEHDSYQKAFERLLRDLRVEEES